MVGRATCEGQQAMAMAMIYPEPAKGGKGPLLNKGGFSLARLSQARSVLRYSPPLAQQVILTNRSGAC